MVLMHIFNIFCLSENTFLKNLVKVIQKLCLECLDDNDGIQPCLELTVIVVHKFKCSVKVFKKFNLSVHIKFNF